MQIIPGLIADNAVDLIAFYKKAFGAKSVLTLTGPNNSIAHADLAIQGALFSISSPSPGYSKSIQTIGESPTVITLEVDDVDGFYNHAVEQGAKAVRPLEDQFYGYRQGRLQDPAGFFWIISKKFKDIPEAEMQKMCDQWAAENP